jgi:uncharacterized protein GlcG (DUF336 family)
LKDAVVPCANPIGRKPSCEERIPHLITVKVHLVKSSIRKLSVSLEGAQLVVAAAIAEAKNRGVSVSVAVVDDGGNVRLVARMDDGAYQNPAVATDKAYTAAGFKRSTAQFYDYVKGDPQLVLGVPSAVPRVTLYGGGVPLVLEGTVIGAVGVAGSGWKSDEEIAQVGAAALEG